MEREYILEVATWLDKNYFLQKERLRRGYSTTDAAWYHATGMLYPQNEKQRIGSESSMSGCLAESLFAAILTALSPVEYSIDTTGKKADEANGYDVRVDYKGKTIGGFALKTGKSGYEGAKSSRVTDFPVINFLMEHTGSKEIIAMLQEGIIPDTEEVVRQRLYGDEGQEMREQLLDQLRRHIHGVPKGAFRDYLEVVGQHVASLNTQRRAS